MHVVVCRASLCTAASHSQGWARRSEVLPALKWLGRLAAEDGLTAPPRPLTSLLAACADAKPRRRGEAELVFRHTAQHSPEPPGRDAIAALGRAVGARRCAELCAELGVSMTGSAGATGGGDARPGRSPPPLRRRGPRGTRGPQASVARRGAREGKGPLLNRTAARAKRASGTRSAIEKPQPSHADPIEGS